MHKTINGWTKQTMLDHVKINFKGKACDYEGRCFYRTPGPGTSKSCVAGMFIPDKSYVHEMEGIPIHKVTYRIQEYMPLELEGMQNLQICHDTSDNASCLENIVNFINHNVVDEMQIAI
jgi:hypothetical protein